MEISRQVFVKKACKISYTCTNLPFFWRNCTISVYNRQKNKKNKIKFFGFCTVQISILHLLFAVNVMLILLSGDDDAFCMTRML